MKLTLELWHVLTLALTLGGMFLGLGRMLLNQFDRRISDRFQQMASDAAGWRETKEKLLEFKIEVGEKYVRREDYIRGQTVIEAKLDAINTEVKLVQIQGAGREH